MKLQAEKIDISSLLIDQKQVLQAQIVRCYEESQTTQEEVDQSLQILDTLYLALMQVAQQDLTTAYYFHQGFDLLFLHKAGNGNLEHPSVRTMRLDFTLVVPFLVTSESKIAESEVREWFNSTLK